MEKLDTARIAHLLEDSPVNQLAVTVVGLGSGGATLLQPLAMAGIARWHLFDPDVLEPVNLVKHPGRRADLGRPKVDVLHDWIMDRNPAAVVDAHAADVQQSDAFEAAAAGSHLVICAVDNPAVRSWINAECVRLRRPCLTGSVMRTGVGGQIYLYAPGATGCFACMQMVADANQLNLENALDLTSEERRERYGIGNADFVTSGLPVDIAIVAGLHAHMAWSVLMGGRSSYVPRLSFNWLTVGIRPEKDVFAHHYATTRVLVKPQRSCYLDCGGTPEDATPEGAA
ncbi:HesA/MoeB/ThiF family protein [Catellatospora bangladeshensis]|uniref:THIF-type NAD/FAD binding fold domain-containing protein n=1 Tax=Catellatospora bangladeshensis TaxID=310355 RepID=A0A8J3JW79_9ACTN|nr:ThiF family adenylyltransferase [Catellatospora bangladeshensis]GIF84204.1 hypothetical protein Cba03nite_55530 [Catellatospora bangladeshensis]